MSVISEQTVAVANQLGYCPPGVLCVMSVFSVQFHLANRAALGRHPHVGYENDIEDILLKVSVCLVMSSWRLY